MVKMSSIWCGTVGFKQLLYWFELFCICLLLIFLFLPYFYGLVYVQVVSSD